MYALYVMKGLYSFELKNKAKMKTETNKTKTLKIPISAPMLERKRKQVLR